MNTQKNLFPDFPFDYLSWISNPQTIGEIPSHSIGKRVAIIGGGISGMVAAYELARIGVRPIIYEAGWIGGRLLSSGFIGVDSDIVAEMGGMRFSKSSNLFWYYAMNVLGLSRRPFPNPLSDVAQSTVIDLLGKRYYGTKIDDFPLFFQQIQNAWEQALRESGIYDLISAIDDGDIAEIKRIWNELILCWDDRTFYDFLCNSSAFSKLPYNFKEIFGQVGFGTGGWDSDFQNSMLEIFRVVICRFESEQYLVSGGAQQVVIGLWEKTCKNINKFFEVSSVKELNEGSPRGRVETISRSEQGQFIVGDAFGCVECYDAVIVTCQSWLLTTSINVEENLFSHDLWMALDRTRYMQASKTFILVSNPFWKLKNTTTGEYQLSMTLTDRLTRGTYLFDYGSNRPAVICLSYSWMGDSMKMLPYDDEHKVKLAIKALNKIYSGINIVTYIRSIPYTISWEREKNFLGAFKGALPGHYRYNYRMFVHFKQDILPDYQRGIFLAGDDISWTPAWAEGAIQTALNAVWGVLHHLGGKCHKDNFGPGDYFDKIKPIELN